MNEGSTNEPNHVKISIQDCLNIKIIFINILLHIESVHDLKIKKICNYIIIAGHYWRIKYVFLRFPKNDFC